MFPTPREKMPTRLEERPREVENLPAVRPQSQAQARQVEWVKPLREEESRATRHSEVTSSETECERLRAHCEELLRLNASMRQQQLELTMGSFTGKFDHLLREFSHLRGFHQTLRSVVEVGAQSRKELKDLHQVVAPIGEMSSLMDRAIGSVRETLREDVRHIVAEEVASLREQLTRIHENSTRIVGLTLSHRSDFDEHRHGLSQVLRGELDEITGLARESKSILVSNSAKLEKTWTQVMSNKKTIDKNAETINKNAEIINANKRSIEENSQHIQSNKALIRDEQESARKEAQAAMERMHALQAELQSQEHTAAERMALEKEISDNQQYQDAIEAEMNRLSGEMQEGFKEEMEGMTAKIEATLHAVEQLIERIDRPPPDLCHQLRAVVEITRRGNLDVNLSNGDVKLKKNINFRKKNPGEAPTAEFENEQDAREILRDIADLWQMFKTTVVVEGHTKDIGAGAPNFWEDVANSRASLCAATLGVMGVDLGQVVATGKPGKSGLNKAALVIHFDLFPDLN